MIVKHIINTLRAKKYGKKICDCAFVSMFDILVLLKIVACMPESTLVKKQRQDHPITMNLYVPLYEPHLPSNG